MNTIIAQQAITESADTHTIITVEYDADTLLTLKTEAEDYVDIGQADGTYTFEFWGEDWRVHMTGVEL